MTAHELILSEVVDGPDAKPVDPVASLVAMGQGAYPFIRRFLDTWYPGNNAFVLSSDGRVSMTIVLLCYGSILWDQTPIIRGMPIIDASVLWSFIATDPTYQPNR
jgi:hypothetical protein